MANVQRETVKGIQLIPVEDHFFSERKIFMVGEIDSELCYRVVQQLLYFEASDNRKEVTIYINSPGGEVQAGLAVYDVMRLMKSPIKGMLYRAVCKYELHYISEVMLISGLCFHMQR